MADNTFLGLQPYTEDDAYRFKGRTEESQELFRLIVRNDFTVCYAESGEGKTSLLNAGVFPLLRENMYFPIAITFTSDDYKVTPDSFDAIIDRCIKDSITEYNEKNKGVNVEYKLCSTDFQELECQAELQQKLSKYSWWKLRNYKPQAMGLSFTPVFVFDQFEEVFNLPGSIVWTKKFFDWLEDVSSDSCPDEIAKKVRAIIGDKAAFPTIKEEKGFKAVFSLRKEFIGELDYWGMQKCFIPSLKNNRYCLKALTYEGAKKVMTQQERFDESKVEQILTYFVSQYSRDPEKTIEEGLPVIPALLLSVVCDSWEKDMNAFAELSTAEIGQSLNSVLERFFDEAIEAIVREISQRADRKNYEDKIIESTLNELMQTRNFYEVGHKVESLKSKILSNFLEILRKDINSSLFDLVDINGKRVRIKAATSFMTRRVGEEELRIIKYKEILNTHRIIKITKIDGEDYVEIVHDCLCPIIAKRREAQLAAEAKDREEKRLHEQAQKNRKRTRLMSGIILIACVVIGFFYYQNRIIEKSQWRMLENQARAVATKALGLIEEGDAYTASILAISVLPSNLDNPERPYTPEAEYALRMSLKQQSVTMYGHRDHINSVLFSPNGKEIVSSANDSSVIIWDANTGNMKYELKGHEGCVNFASYNPESTRIVSGSNDGTIRIWDALVGKELLKIDVDEWIETAVYSPDGSRIATVAQGTIQLWDSKDGTEMLKIPVHLPEETTFNGERSLCFNTDSMQINTVFFSPDGKKLVSASNDETVRIWDANTGKELKRLIGHHDQVKSASFNPNGQTVLSISWFEGVAIIWDAETGKMLLREDKPYSIRSAMFSNDGKHVVFSSDNDSIYILNASTLVEENSYKAHTDVVSFASFSPSNHFLISSSWDKTVKMYRIDEPQTGILQINTKPSGLNFDATYSLDCEKIITSNPLIIWDAQTGEKIDSLTNYRGTTLFKHYRIDDVTQNDKIPFITDNGSKETVTNLHSYKGEQISFACFSENNYGKYELKISQDDHSALVYNVDYGTIVDKKVGHTCEISSASFSSDGQRIMAASVDGKVLVWDFLPLQELIDKTKERFKKRQLTSEERRKYYLE